jgi:hypothetical protein
MKRSLLAIVLVFLAVPPAGAQTKSQAPKVDEVLRAYEKLISVHQRLQQLDSGSQELQKEFGAFLESDSTVHRLIGFAMFVGALKAWVPEIKSIVTEEDSLITELVTASSRLTGDPARNADEGVRLLREQQVYLQQNATRTSSLLDGMTDSLRSVREETLADFPAQLEQQQLDSQLRAIDELDQKQELTFARAKDAFSRFKATMK